MLGGSMGITKEIEFEAGGRSYRVITSLDNTYDIHGFNSLTEQVRIHTDLNTGERIFVQWKNVAVLRFKDASSDGEDDLDEDDDDDEDDEDDI